MLQILSIFVSLASVFIVFKTSNWRNTIRLFNPNISIETVILFILLALLILWLTGLRWNWLIGSALCTKTLLIASLLSAGGNMFLPFRGGDLLRVHYSHLTGQVSHTMGLSRLLIEKMIDLMTVMIVGILSIILLKNTGVGFSQIFIYTVVVGFFILVILTLFIKYANQILLKYLRLFFKKIGKFEGLERRLIHLIRDISGNLSISIMLKPTLLTIVIWLTVYVPSYMLIAHIVGVTLHYNEAILVLFAGAVGLMIPAAPSGIGTFHVSVISAFIMLGRSSSQGLLVGTAIHIAFLIIYVTPTIFLYMIWLFKRELLN
ncbi:lysylphosphatidylglycerol synthase transmembrane domain-containing protein [Ferrovum sp. PN-J185]|uniref:lysylphosphatidylglycerol synthase transmembrane domain-containing protein n=1 Tax=Ferrovum sp. PN-J185 TaxID=1356306 RepID=UPI00079CC253|nr:lysylphosphatidylglycerol synthase transmembrane domain-containing protein [Ferrovum sp. PN-J185]KXW55842.1 hypothetical protein FV185_10020 [Ferrovum sp. PN-J185]